MRNRRVAVTVSNDLLNHYNLTIFHVVQRLEEENVISTAGAIEMDETRFLVRCNNPLDSPTRVGEVILVTRNREIIRLRDVAKVAYESPIPYHAVRFNGKRVLGLDIYKETLARTVDVSNVAEAEMKKIQAHFAYRNIEFFSIRHQARGIKQALNGLRKNALQGAFVAIIILFLFLLRGMPTLIISTAIPFAIALTFSLMQLFSVSLNIVSISGLIVGMGMLVDNSIVVLESIEAKWASGRSAGDAAIEGTCEVGGAIFASTLTTIIVFLPVTFVQHEIVALFRDMALTVTFALVASLTVALTIIPFFFSIRPRRTIKKNAAGNSGKPLQLLKGSYRSVVPPLFNIRWLTFLGVVVLAVCAGYTTKFSDLRGLPELDFRILFVQIKMPQNSTRKESLRTAEMTSGKLRKVVPAIENIYTVAEQSRAWVLAILPLEGDRKISTREAAKIVKKICPRCRALKSA